ncbi:MAG: hypothetical protein ACRDQ2_07400 [Gaiellales bacterium]
MDPGNIASLVSALVSGLSLLLGELRHRKSGDVSSEELRVALFEFEEYLAAWAHQAVGTNEVARAWAGSLPQSAGRALDTVIDSAAAQSMWIAAVDSALGRQVGLIPPSHLPGGPGQATLERVLRVYAPEFFELLVVFSRRKEQLLGMTDELERRYAEGGRDSVEEYLSELDSAAEGLEEARRRLAQFISSEFPIGSSQDKRDDHS